MKLSWQLSGDNPDQVSFGQVREFVERVANDAGVIGAGDADNAKVELTTGSGWWSIEVVMNR